MILITYNMHNHWRLRKIIFIIWCKWWNPYVRWCHVPLAWSTQIQQMIVYGVNLCIFWNVENLNIWIQMTIPYCIVMHHVIMHIMSIGKTVQVYILVNVKACMHVCKFLNILLYILAVIQIRLLLFKFLVKVLLLVLMYFALSQLFLFTCLLKHAPYHEPYFTFLDFLMKIQLS